MESHHINSLSNKIPNNEELLDLDSFDLAFCCATGHAHFVDTNDILFKTVTSLKQIDFKTVTLWGPETELVSKVFARAWKEQSGSKLNDIRSAFDVSGDITVNAKKVHTCLKKMKQDGEKVWKKVWPAVVQALATAAERADGYFEKQSKRSRRKKQEEHDWNEFVAVAMADHVALYTKAYPDRILHPEIIRLVGLVEADPASRLIDKAELKNRINKINKMPASYFNGVSDVHVGRCWNFTGLQAAKEQSVTTYIWKAQKDARTCKVCFRLDGKTFDVDDAHGKVEKYLKAAGKGKKPDILSKLMGFPRVKDIDNMSPEQISKQGWQPPAHSRCRCDIQFLWKRRK